MKNTMYHFSLPTPLPPEQKKGRQEETTSVQDAERLISNYDRYQSCCYMFQLPRRTVADYQLLCLWVPSLITGRHTFNGSRSLRKSPDNMLVPASSCCVANMVLHTAGHQLSTLLAGGNSTDYIMPSVLSCWLPLLDGTYMCTAVCQLCDFYINYTPLGLLCQPLT